MNYEFKKDQSEEYYRKLLLLDKLKPFLINPEKQYIFDKGYCQELLSKDDDMPELCYLYAKFNIEKRYKKGEKYIVRNPVLTYKYYLEFFLKKNKRWKLGEKYLEDYGYKNHIEVLRKTIKNKRIYFLIFSFCLLLALDILCDSILMKNFSYLLPCFSISCFTYVFYGFYKYEKQEYNDSIRL